MPRSTWRLQTLRTTTGCRCLGLWCVELSSPAVVLRASPPCSHLQIATAEFDNPAQALNTTATWFNLSVTAPLVNCPQLPHNSSVWVSIVPKAPITLPTLGVFYDGIIWLGAQVGPRRLRSGSWAPTGFTPRPRAELPGELVPLLRMVDRRGALHHVRHRHRRHGRHVHHALWHRVRAAAQLGVALGSSRAAQVGAGRPPSAQPPRPELNPLRPPSAAGLLPTSPTASSSTAGATTRGASLRPRHPRRRARSRRRRRRRPRRRARLRARARRR